MTGHALTAANKKALKYIANEYNNNSVQSSKKTEINKHINVICDLVKGHVNFRTTWSVRLKMTQGRLTWLTTKTVV